MSKSSLAERVTRGAALLDKREPGWYRKIDLSQLSMMNADWCVLGQTDTNFWKHSHVLGLRKSLDLNGDMGRTAEYGFAAGEGDTPSAWETLDTLWKIEIENRLCAEPREVREYAMDPRD